MLDVDADVDGAERILDVCPSVWERTGAGTGGGIAGWTGCRSTANASAVPLLVSLGSARLRPAFPARDFDSDLLAVGASAFCLDLVSASRVLYIALGNTIC